MVTYAKFDTDAGPAIIATQEILGINPSMNEGYSCVHCYGRGHRSLSQEGAYIVVVSHPSDEAIAIFEKASLVAPAEAP